MRLGAPVEIVRATAREAMDQDLGGLAAQIAYRLVFALPPLLIFFGALSSLVARYTGVDVFQRLLELAGQALPSAIYQTIEMLLAEVRSEGGGQLASVGLIIALWSASGAVAVMMKAFNRAYGVAEQRPFVRRRLLAIALTVGLSVLVIAAFVLFVFGGELGTWIADQAGLGAAFTEFWSVARWAVAVVLAMFALSVVYTTGPTVDTPFRTVIGGTVLATALWVGASLGFGYYLQVADPGSAYGALGAAVVLLFFLYVSSIILLLGAVLNAVLDKRYNRPHLPQQASAGDELRGRAAARTAEQPTHQPPRRAAAVAVARLGSLVIPVTGALAEALRRLRPGRV